jgi:hypothetical protein
MLLPGLATAGLAAETGRAAGDPEEAASKRLSFGILADLHYADRDTAHGRHYRSSLERLSQCVADLNARDLAFAVQLGDLIDGEMEDLDRILPAFDRLTMPKYHVLGNHDFPAARSEIMARLGLDSSYYTFGRDGWRFIVLDTVDIGMDGGWPEDSESYRRAEQWVASLKSEGKSNAETWNGAVGEQQRRWLSQVLQEATARGERAIIFGHVPAAAGTGGERHLLYNHEEIAHTIESCDCVAACFSGHHHDGGYVQRDGVHHVTLEGMVEGPDENAYAVVDLRDDSIDIRGVGRASSRMLHISAGCADAEMTGG